MSIRSDLKDNFGRWSPDETKKQYALRLGGLLLALAYAAFIIYIAVR